MADPSSVRRPRRAGAFDVRRRVRAIFEVRFSVTPLQFPLPHSFLFHDSFGIHLAISKQTRVQLV